MDKAIKVLNIGTKVTKVPFIGTQMAKVPNTGRYLKSAGTPSSDCRMGTKPDSAAVPNPTNPVDSPST